MVQDCVRSCSWLLLVLAGYLSLACGTVTTPEIQRTTDPRDNDDDDQAGDEPSRPPVNNVIPMDGGSPPRRDDETGCDPITVAGLSVTLGGPDFQCDDLRVIATADDFEEELACSIREERCRCFGVHDRPGTYRVSVETGDPAVELTSRNVVIEMDDENCNVETEPVSFRVNAPDGADAGAPDGGGEVDPDPADAGN